MDVIENIVTQRLTVCIREPLRGTDDYKSNAREKVYDLFQNSFLNVREKSAQLVTGSIRIELCVRDFWKHVIFDTLHPPDGDKNEGVHTKHLNINNCNRIEPRAKILTELLPKILNAEFNTSVMTAVHSRSPSLGSSPQAHFQQFAGI